MDCNECISRRKFIEVGVQATASIGMCGTISHLLSGCGQIPTDPGTSGGNGGSSSTNIANSSNNIYTFPFSTYSGLSSVGGTIRVTVNATSGSKTVSITRISTTTVATVSVTCTHAGCTINAYNSSTQKYTCPCHGSIYNSDGTVNTGPATVALTSYMSVLNASDIQVTIP